MADLATTKLALYASQFREIPGKVVRYSKEGDPLVIGAPIEMITNLLDALKEWEESTNNT